MKKVGSKHSGETYAAKMVKYDEDTVEVTKKEFEVWKELDHPNLVLLHDAFFVRKYLILGNPNYKMQPFTNHISVLIYFKLLHNEITLYFKGNIKIS